ncbi:hypothetical protein EV644_115174 [Kribbella orskensis]|uniref:Uncharacterized protein n=1 Tax=Kribbella orskensis TaxID=2512216 RepID=A0ABY2BFQ8_9ACTN|nr:MULTISPECIES: hypothetical protein [Kribbella]TCN35610.1 hypothetical protein EV642_116174 [Kribbella sp. VKM Ac-2500]TCO17152.1 hypothetical protein EV644_115174 [Kribbella orskensis]
MKIQHTRVRRGSARALIAVLLLAGVFTMHGLTGNHDAAMAAAHQMPATTAADYLAPGAAVRPAPGHQKQAAPVTAHPSTDEIGPAAPPSHLSPPPPRPALTVEPGRDGHLHTMGDVCLAMLAGLLLALIVALARRSLTVAHPIQLAGTAVLVAADGPSPPWRRPTLSKLCVLRT